MAEESEPTHAIIDEESFNMKRRFQEAPSQLVSKKQKLLTTSEAMSEENGKNTSESMESFSKELKQTYQRMVGASRPVPYLDARVNDVFVDTKIEELDKIVNDEDRWSLSGSCRDEILKNDAERLLLSGDHGSGKSTLGFALAYEWCVAEEGSPMSKIDIFLFISLRLVPNVKSIYKIIKLLLLPKGYDVKKDTLEKILSNPQRRIVLFFDDFHKFSKTSITCDIHSIIERKMFPAVKVVITTTPNQPNFNSLASHVKRMRITGFDESAKNLYIEKAVACSNAENEENQNLLQLFKENYLLGGLGHLPLYFAMFVHLVSGTPELAKKNSITDYYECLRKRFFKRPMHTAQTGEISSVISSCGQKLEEIAFDGLTSSNQHLLGGKIKLVEKLGSDVYKLYKSVGILLQEENFKDVSDDAQELDDEVESELRVRFCDKSIQEYYAAHHLVRLMKKIDPKEASLHSEYLDKLNPLNVGFCYLFASLLDNTVANMLMNYLSDKYKEQVGVSVVCKDGVCIDSSRESKHHQLAKVFFLTIASELKKPIECVTLKKMYGSMNVRTGNFESEDGLYLPPLRGAKTLCLDDDGRVWTENEFKRVLEYVSACDGLVLLKFENCMLPFDVSEEADVLQELNKEFCVEWVTRNEKHFLKLNPFRWLHLPMLCQSYTLEDLYLSKEGSTLNHFLLRQVHFEQDERGFYHWKRKTEWQRTHISSEPTTRNCVSDSALRKISSKIEGDWRALASRLQISKCSISSINDVASTGAPQKRMLKTLKRWKGQSPTEATPQALERALRYAAQNDVADALNEAIVEESTALVTKKTSSKDEGVIQLVDTNPKVDTEVKLHIPIKEFQSSHEVTINILPYHSLGDTTEHFEDNSTVAVQLLPNKLKLSCAAKLTLPHCLKLKNVVNSDVKIFRSFHETGAKPVWKDVTASVTFQLLENCCEINLQELCSIKYTICSTNVEAKRLTFYAFGNKCNVDAKNVSVDIGCHPDLPGEKTIYRRKLRENFLGDSQSFFFYKNEGPINPRISLVQVLPSWAQCHVTSVSMGIFRPATVPLSEKSCTFTFKRPCSSAILPRCVFEVSGNPHRPKYRLNVNFRVFQQLVTHTSVVEDDYLFFLSHYLNDNWLNIGRRLQVHENHLQEIRNKDISLQLKAYLMMIKWKHNERERAFGEILSTALNEEVELTSEPRTLLMGNAARDNAASINEKDDRVLSKKISIMNGSDVSAAGGPIGIDGTGVELKLRRRSFRNPNEKKKIGIRVLPDQVFQEPANCFEAYSTTVVELLPKSLQLEESASLYLPHCLKLRNAKDCEVRIFQSYHNQDDNHLWEDITSTVKYELSNYDCKIDIKKFGWIKYTIRGTQVEGKKLTVYALGENCNQDNRVNVHIGYHLDLPGRDSIIKENLQGKFHAVSTKFLCSKKEREDVEVKCVKTEPKWELDSPDVERKLPFLNIESSLKGNGCKFQFERDRRSSNLPRCDFEIFQGNQPERSRISITFTPPNLPYFDEDEEVTWQFPSEQLQSDGSSETEQEGVPDELRLNYVHQLDRRVDRVVSEKLLQALSREITIDWKTIGRNLGPNEKSISMVIQKYQGPDVSERPLQMLLSWKRREGKDANRSKLRRAFLESERKDIADKLNSDDDDEEVIKSLKGKK